MDRVNVAGLSIAEPLQRFLETEVFPGAAVSSERFWSGYADLLRELGPRLGALLARGTISRPRSTITTRAAAASRSTPPITSASCARSAISRPMHRRAASLRQASTTRSPAWPGRSSSFPCRTPATPSMPPMPGGAASMTRSMAPTPSRTRERRRAAARAITRPVAQPSSPKPRPSSTTPCRSPAPPTRTSSGLAIVDGAVRATLTGGRTAALATPDALVGLHRSGQGPEDGPAAP